ncbi:MAG: hypothetical protein IPN90_08115 [Elusimicrobia bacterium]|nr:hypothetical protein [Elusimicrobiota bacterium]
MTKSLVVLFFFMFVCFGVNGTEIKNNRLTVTVNTKDASISFPGFLELILFRPSIPTTVEIIKGKPPTSTNTTDYRLIDFPTIHMSFTPYPSGPLSMFIENPFPSHPELLSDITVLMLGYDEGGHDLIPVASIETRPCGKNRSDLCFDFRPNGWQDSSGKYQMEMILARRTQNGE